ncbi:MAG: alkaline phosphatase family protein [Desulfomonilaceae bacterium]
MLSIHEKVVVIGLDGVPFSLLEHLFETGNMPHLADIAKHGTFRRMMTSHPAVSSVAWTSFMTGKNPGEHGIFGFTDLKPGEIALRLPSFDDIQQPVLWHETNNLNSIVVNLPFTYPARPLRGVLIAGFVAPVFERAIYPHWLIDWLRSKNYRIDVDAVKGRQNPELLINDLFETTNVHEEIMLGLMSQQPWDLFIGVITGTDRLHHFFFDACRNPAHPRHQDFTEYYRRIDDFFGRLRERLGAKTRLIVLSDHGFTDLKTSVQLNYILKMLGYLRFVRTEPHSIDDIHPGSLAFALDPSRIYLNSRDRFENGALGASAALEIRMRLRDELKKLRLAEIGIRDNIDTDGDENLFDDVYFREEIYKGDCLNMAPDVVVIPRRGYDIKASVNANGPTTDDIFAGMHTHDDAFLIVDEASYSESLSEVLISDVAGLITDTLCAGRC